MVSLFLRMTIRQPHSGQVRWNERVGMPLLPDPCGDVFIRHLWVVVLYTVVLYTVTHTGDATEHISRQ